MEEKNKSLFSSNSFKIGSIFLICYLLYRLCINFIPVFIPMRTLKGYGVVFSLSSLIFSFVYFLGLALLISGSKQEVAQPNKTKVRLFKIGWGCIIALCVLKFMPFDMAKSQILYAISAFLSSLVTVLGLAFLIIGEKPKKYNL